MKPRSLVILLVLGVLLAVSAAVSAQEGDGIRWESDLAAARDKAAETGRPLMVVFR